MLTDYMRQVNSLSAILTKDVSEIKRMVSSSYTSLELKLSMAVMAVEGLQTKVDALNVLAESHRNDGYDYKVCIFKHICVCVLMCVHVYVRVCTHVCMHMHMCTVRVLVCVRMHMLM